MISNSQGDLALEHEYRLEFVENEIVHLPQTICALGQTIARWAENSRAEAAMFRSDEYHPPVVTVTECACRMYRSVARRRASIGWCTSWDYRWIRRAAVRSTCEKNEWDQTRIRGDNKCTETIVRRVASAVDWVHSMGLGWNLSSTESSRRIVCTSLREIWQSSWIERMI